MADSIALGASAGEPARAVQKALQELWATTTRVSVVETSAPASALDVVTPADHALYGLSGRYRSRPEFIDNDDGSVALADLAGTPRLPDEVYFYRWAKELSAPYSVNKTNFGKHGDFFLKFYKSGQ